VSGRAWSTEIFLDYSGVVMLSVICTDDTEINEESYDLSGKCILPNVVFGQINTNLLQANQVSTSSRTDN
jgi:hypothetical protein